MVRSAAGPESTSEGGRILFEEVMETFFFKTTGVSYRKQADLLLADACATCGTSARCYSRLLVKVNLLQARDSVVLQNLPSVISFFVVVGVLFSALTDNFKPEAAKTSQRRRAKPAQSDRDTVLFSPLRYDLYTRDAPYLFRGVRVNENGVNAFGFGQQLCL